MSLLPLLSLVIAVAHPAPAKLDPEVGKQMQEVIVAVDKALGLESWDTHGAKPCIDRGGLEATAKDVSAADTRKCAASAIGKELTGLGKSYVVAILMAPIGPVTAIALGIDEADGWGAYSCDPGRKCPPLRLDPTKKWGKRVLDWRAKACAAADTVWFPEDRRACPGR